MGANAADPGPALVLRGSAPVEAALAALGWQAEPDGPVRPWLRPGGFPALVDHHDPITGLRWLDLADVPPAARVAIAAALPPVTPEDLGAWLGDPAPEVRLRGVWAVDRLDAQAFAARLGVLRLDPAPEVALAAERTLDRWRREPEARARAALAVAALTLTVRPVLEALGRAEVQAVLPEPGDAARVFAPAVAPGAADAYARWWAEQGGRVRAVGAPGGSSAPEVHAVPAGLLRRPGEHLRPLPQGLAGVAGALVPERVWVAWRWATTGSTFDGLVWTGEAWRWFPKPYRVLRPVLEGLWG